MENICFHLIYSIYDTSCILYIYRYICYYMPSEYCIDTILILYIIILI